MNTDRIIFSQIMDFFPKHQFNQCVRRYRGNYRLRTFSCFDQFLCMAFAQLLFKESLRDIEICLRAMKPKLYHAGFRGNIAKSTLADANEKRPWQIYADFAQLLIARARTLYRDDSFGIDLKNTTYALDSTTIDLCLTLFPWAQFRKHKSAVKVHTLMDLKGSIPCFIRITGGSVHDVNFIDELPIEAGAFYIMDRGYIDFARLYTFTKSMAFFVTRAKTNLDYTRISYLTVDKSTGLRSDQTIMLRGLQTSKDYPASLRRISYYDKDINKRFVFLTNNFTLNAIIIAKLYKCRWQIELFFKWLKQNLHIKAFFGTSENAVKTQIWIAVSVYVLIAIIKKELKLQHSLAEILQIISVSIFEQVSLQQILTEIPMKNKNFQNYKQLSLFDL
ncbi:MAG: transposase [Planctomycetes bacterium GWC2_45_44]|nr:MAG: transposase [Planctomycetes bacterium GWC2_45_44]